MDIVKHRLTAGIILGLFLCIFIPFSYAYDQDFFHRRERVMDETLCRLNSSQQYDFSTKGKQLSEVVGQEKRGPNIEPVYQEEGLILDEVALESTPSHTWEIGTEVSHITYKEPGLMKDKGTMHGICCSYTYRGWAPPAPEELDKWRLTLEVRYSFGEVDYSGSTWAGTPLDIDNIDDFIWEIRGLIGYDLPIFRTSTIIPYFGMGYRYLNDDAHEQYAGGYERESNYYYTPIGVEFITDLGTGWSIGAILEYDIFWSGEQISHFSDTNPAYNDPENDQDRGYGCRASLELKKKCKRIDFVIEPFIRYWNIKESKLALLTMNGIPWVYIVEPKNNSTEYGIKFAVRF